MNLQIQNQLSDLAKHVGGIFEFTTGLPIRFYDCQHAETPIAEIDSDLPQSVLIFRMLYEIRLKYLNSREQNPVPIPFFVNRPYENEFAGEVAYKTRRALRRFCGKEWQAEFWALWTYCELGYSDDLKDFLSRHPEKLKLMVIIIPFVWSTRLMQGFQKSLRAI